MKDKFLSNLGLCRRAGALFLGAEAVTAAVRKGEAALVVTAADISEKSLKKVVTLTDFYHVDHKRSDHTMANLADALGVLHNVAVFAVKKSTFINLF